MHNFSSFIYSRAKNQEELAQILEIQRRNTKARLAPAEIESDGFVTVVHDMSILNEMNQTCPHIIANYKQQVVGYALAMDPVHREKVPVLKSLFELTDGLMNNRKYLVMGQICIDKPYRGQGVFRGMYNFYRQQLMNDFECLVTEVAVENKRSIRAHKRIGFDILLSRTAHGKDWEILVWEWAKLNP